MPTLLFLVCFVVMTAVAAGVYQLLVDRHNARKDSR